MVMFEIPMVRFSTFDEAPSEGFSYVSIRPASSSANAVEARANSSRHSAARRMMRTMLSRSADGDPLFRRKSVDPDGDRLKPNRADDEFAVDDLTHPHID